MSCARVADRRPPTNPPTGYSATRPDPTRPGPEQTLPDQTLPTRHYLTCMSAVSMCPENATQCSRGSAAPPPSATAFLSRPATSPHTFASWSRAHRSMAVSRYTLRSWSGPSLPCLPWPGLACRSGQLLSSCMLPVRASRAEIGTVKPSFCVATRLLLKTLGSSKLAMKRSPPSR